MRDGNASQCRRRHGGGDPRDDVDANTGSGDRQRFFAAAAQHERIAALQAHHMFAAARHGDEQPVDVFLTDAAAAGALTDAEARRVRRQRQHLGRHERVVQHDVGLAQSPDRLHRQELGIARSRADERDKPRAHPSSEADIDRDVGIRIAVTLRRVLQKSSGEQVRVTGGHFRLL